LSVGGESGPIRPLEESNEKDRGMLEEITRDANASDVTIYTMQPMGLVTGSSITDQDDGSHAANVFTSGEAGRRQDRASSAAGSLIRLAEQTGGSFITNSNDLSAGVGRIERELANYYSLAYKPAAAVADEQSRKIVVRTVNRDLRVRARRSVLERSPDVQIAQELTANLMFPINANQLGIVVRSADSARRSRRRIAVPVDVIIPYSTLAFTSEGKGFVAELSFFVASSDDQSNVSEIRRYDRKVVIGQGDLKRLSKQFYVYGMDIDLQTRTRKNRITIGVIDQLSKARGFGVVEIPAPVMVVRK